MIKFLVGQYKTKGKRIIDSISTLKHETLILQQNNQCLLQQCQSLESENTQLQTSLQHFKDILRRLEQSNVLQIQQDFNFWKQNEQTAHKYKESLVSEDQIINSSVVNTPDASLDKLQDLLCAITQQKLMEAIQIGKEKRIIIENLGVVKERYERVKQNKCKGFKSRSKKKNQGGQDYNKR